MAAAPKVVHDQVSDRSALDPVAVHQLLDAQLAEGEPERPDRCWGVLGEDSLDFASLDAVSRTLTGLFWARIEALAPGIDSLRLPLEVARAWKEDLRVKKRTVTSPGGRSIEKLLINALAATGLTNADGEALTFSPHDFRRIFVTDAIMNGLPPHIAQVICGHKRIDTTMGYKAVYPAETIEAHPSVHRPPPNLSPQRRVPNPDRGRMGCLPRPLREEEGVHWHLRTRLRNPLHP
jgi:hypothetical protein